MKALTIALLLATGCCAVDVSQEGGRDMVTVRNEGWKLFSCIPIASGDPIYPNQEVANWFEDTVTLKTNMTLLDEAMKDRGYSGFRDITSYKRDEVVVPFLFKRYIYHTSAELQK